MMVRVWSVHSADHLFFQQEGFMKFYLIALSLFFSTFLHAVEYKRGLIIPKDWKSKATFVSSFHRGMALPSEFDWRLQKTMSPIMNQGSCGSCWAFSASATFRDALVVQAGQSYANSVQEVLDCNAQNYGCQGGFFDVDQFFVSPGTSHEQAYGAYVGKKQTCKKITKTNSAISWHYVALSSNGTPSKDEMKAAIAAYGPISIGVAAGSSWSSYTGGIYKTCNNSSLNHAVQLIGWSDAGQYWILRNSWGTQWGESGYMRIAYVNSAGQPCDGVGEAANYFKVTSTPSPTPSPDPTPTPGPTPPPTPPGPCSMPKASTGKPAEFKATIGTTYTMGIRAVKGVSYSWSAEPPFNNGAAPKVSIIGYKPTATKTLTVTATNDCGTSSASTSMLLNDIVQ
jgi:hypothetical protein